MESKQPNEEPAGDDLGRQLVNRRQVLFGAMTGSGLIGWRLAAWWTQRHAGGRTKVVQRPAAKAEQAAPAAQVALPVAQPAPIVLIPRSPDPAVVQTENAQPGSSAWQIKNYAALGEIQGYASRASVNAGEALDFHVSTRLARMPYRIDFYRMGWYGGAGARLVSTAGDLRGQVQGFYTTSTGLNGCKASAYDATTGHLDVNWTPSYQLQVPDSWLSGVYLALLTDANGKQTYVPFVVRQDNRPSALLLKASFNTYQAYNAWGSKSLYPDNSTGANTVGGSIGAVKVSFNRPFDADLGSGEFLRYEYNLLRWVERMGYDVSYVADGDISANGGLLLQHNGFISAGHDEYWTADERNSVEAALSAGVHLAFLSGDAVYWQARYEPAAAGDANRTLVVYRCAADPLYQSDPAHATVRWQDPPLNRPQHMLTGTLYAGQTDPFTQDWVVQDTGSWLFTGTGLQPGDKVAGLVGKEFDGVPTNLLVPPGLQILSSSPITVAQDDRPPDVAYANTTVYTAPSGATVFSAGTVTWGWGLDDSSFPIGRLHQTPVSAAIQRITQNLLDRFTGTDSDNS